MSDDVRLICGEARGELAKLPAQSVQTCITSPPYWGLRDYGTATWEGGDAVCDHAQEAPRFNGAKQTRAQVSGHASKAESHGRKQCQKCGAKRVDWQLGLEATPQEYVANLVQVLEGVRRALRDDGTLWLNLGDSYITKPIGSGSTHDPKWKNGRNRKEGLRAGRTNNPASLGLKHKDMAGIPWAVAFALRGAGWWLRQEVIWQKPNCMTENVQDRPTTAHEHLFLLSKAARYYYDAEAIREPCQSGPSDKKKMVEKLPRIGGKHKDLNDPLSKASATTNIGQKRSVGDPDGRNCRSVWTVPTVPYPGAHFATFPPKLIEPCVLAGAPEGGIVLDPFAGSGTTLAVAILHGRGGIGIELNPEYIGLANDRIAEARKERAARLEALTMPLFDGQDKWQQGLLT